MAANASMSLHGITKQLLWCLFLTDFLLHFLSYEFLKIIFI